MYGVPPAALMLAVKNVFVLFFKKKKRGGKSSDSARQHEAAHKARIKTSAHRQCAQSAATCVRFIGLPVTRRFAAGSPERPAGVSFISCPAYTEKINK